MIIIKPQGRNICYAISKRCCATASAGTRLTRLQNKLARVPTETGVVPVCLPVFIAIYLWQGDILQGEVKFSSE